MNTCTTCKFNKDGRCQNPINGRMTSAYMALAKDSNEIERPELGCSNYRGFSKQG
jgi:hypothetical protein